MTFEQALKAMCEGKKVFRVDWTKSKDIEKIICSRSNLFILNCDDIFANDWEICLEIPAQDETVRETMKKILEKHQATINAAMKKARTEFLGEDFDKPYGTPESDKSMIMRMKEMGFLSPDYVESCENERKALKESLEKIKELEEKCKYWQDKYDGALHTSIKTEKELQTEKECFEQMQATLRFKDERINYLLGKIEVYEKMLNVE